MKLTDLINLLAVILIPIAAVIIGQFLQDRSEKRKDKMKIFQCLMTYRSTGWGNSFEAVAALNSIDIVFVHDKKVRTCWASLLSKYNLALPPTQQTLQDQANAQWKLLESMAICLGYKDKITWENIQNPYFPVGLQRQIENNAKFQNGQLAFAEMISQMQNAPGQSAPFVSAPTKATQEDTAHANP